MSILLRKNKLYNLDPAVKEIDLNKNELSSSTSKSNPRSSLVVGDGVKISGSITAEDEVKVHGKIDTDVEAKSITIGINGELDGKIKTIVLEVQGKASGEIEVENLIKVLSSGIIEGKITYQKLEVEEGGRIKGELFNKQIDNLESK